VLKCVFMNKINKLAIFCGSKTGKNKLYPQHAVELASIMAENKIELVYGGGKNGIMGIVADTVMNKGGIVRGVIPKVLADWEHQHDGISELLVVDDMHIRKRKMYELCDGVVILPGGFGTLEELFETLTWNQLSIHDKKVFILNTLGFYDHLLRHLEFLNEEGFLWNELKGLLVVLKEPKELLKYL
jgi:uncharacterized protein (TIGR00730 family)